MSPHETVGVRIRELRAIRDYSLSELGRRAHVSASQLSRIENGDRAASPDIVASVARALGVGVSVLHGQPYMRMLQQDRLDALLAPISSALDVWDMPEADLPPRPLDEIASRSDEINHKRAQGDFAAVADALPDVIAAATLTALNTRPGAERERAYETLAHLSRTAAIVAYRLGYMDLARLALSRMAMAAPLSGDPRQVAIERYERAVITHAETSRPDRGVSLMRQALNDLDDDGEPATLAVRGTLLLRASALSATQGDHDAAAGWLDEADALARDGAARDAAEPSAGDRYSLAFGELNVELGRLDVALARDDHPEALAVASRIQMPDEYQPTRRAGFYIRRAVAEAWTAHHDQALGSLVQAREAAPQLTRYHPEVHETVGVLLRARQRAADPLRDFASWSGV